MTTELHAEPILDDSRPASRAQNSRDANSTNPSNQWSQPESSTDETGASTPIDPLDPPPPRPPHAHLEESTAFPRPLLVKARTTGDYVQHLHNQSRNRFLMAEGGPLAVRKFSLSDDYGLDELRAPPILPDRERRKSLEHSLSRRPSLAQRTRRQQIHEDIIVGSWITFLSIWGSLARMGLTALTTYPGEPVFPLIWSQWVGCAVMGFLLQDKTLFPKEDRYVALYIGLTTGFCGSVTSFSAFMWDCFQAMANLDPYFERERGRNVLALLAQVVITLCVSIAALRLGAHCAQLTRSLLPSLRPLPGIKWYLDIVGLVLAISAWSAGGIMTGLIPEWRSELFAVVLAPAGALCRWQLSRFNPYIPSFPLGTFAANMAGTVILGICILLQSRDRSLTTISCAVLYGVDTGFCGCLSTISTFAVELDTLMRLHAYVYATVSIVAGIVSLVVLVGISAWTVGYVSVCGL